jgi:feruloyl-CoA synthase
MKMQQSSHASAPMHPIDFAPIDVSCESSADGSRRLSSRTQLGSYDPSLANLFHSAVDREPTRVFLAERVGESWQKLTYEHTRLLVNALAAALIERGLSADRPLMILSGNAIDHALLMLAGFTAGIPIAPISVAYSLQSQDHGKLKYIVELLTPGLVYVSDTGPFARALTALETHGAEIVARRNTANLTSTTALEDLIKTQPTRAVDEAVARIDGETIAKFLFTSGSTDLPKAVINTHRMLTVNQQALAQVWPFVTEDELVLVDWLPWSHTFGGNHNFNLVLRHAGTLYIDAGKPVPTLVEHTVRNLAEVSPTIYFNVPAGFAALLPYLEKDTALAKSFFAKLRLIFYAGAALPQDLWSRLEAISVRATGKRVPMTSSWGATETAPAVTAAHFALDRAGVIGIPIPGVQLKLLPNGPRWEVRVKGPNVTPGYWRSPDLTAAAFDDDGFYRIGDAVRFADPNDPAKGLIYDGRLTEDFKLTTGTWVHVGALRVGVLAAVSPALQDAVIAGEGHDSVRILAWLNPGGCRQLLGDGAPSDVAALARHPAIRRHVLDALKRWNSQNTGHSTRIRCALLLGDTPSIDANEITDKGYINQRAALTHRKTELERLFASERHADIIVVDD